MNKMITNIVFVIIAVIIFVIFGNMFFLINVKQELNRTETELEARKQEIENINNRLENPITESQKISDNIVLNNRQEGQLMNLFINENLQKHFKVKSYDLYENYFYKPETQNDESLNSISTFNQETTEKLPELDENGMPLNAYTASDNSEWTGLRVLPIKMTFSATAEHFNTILGYFQQLPVNTFRAADFIINQKTISGTLVFTFPINDFN